MRADAAVASRRGLARPRVLFVSYNGLIEPLGATQVLPYVRGLTRWFELAVLSFEKPVRSLDEDAGETLSVERTLAASRVPWLRLRYHKRPSLPATLFDIASGVTRVLVEHRRGPFDLLHARGHVAAAIALGVKRAGRVPFLFDIRGLLAEEYAAAGHWGARGLHFHLTKRVEQSILRDADGIVTLTETIRPHFQEQSGLRIRSAPPPWSVIPSCVNLEHFQFDPDLRRAIRERLAVGDRSVLVYAGSVGMLYQLDEMLAFYEAARERWPGLFLLLLVNGEAGPIVSTLQARGIGAGDSHVRRVGHEEMPGYLSAADAGIAFIRPSFSKRSSSPTKYGEYLACGLPFVTNPGIGDIDAFLTRSGAGVIIRAHDADAYRDAADRLRTLAVPENRPRWRAVAEREYSLDERALPAYAALYRRILSGRAHEPSPTTGLSAPSPDRDSRAEPRCRPARPPSGDLQPD